MIIREMAKPQEHPHVIRRPEIIFDPLHEAAVEQRLVKNVHNVRGEERPRRERLRAA
jgi:hypothetical protein